MSKQFYIYIMTNKHHSTLYTGMTNNLERRVYEHQNGQGSAFTTRYKLKKLIYYEVCDTAETAINREKQIKSGSRQKKLDLIARLNPDWLDLAQKF